MMVKCEVCGSIFGSPPYQAGDLCTMPRCDKVPVAYRRQMNRRNQYPR